MSNLITSVNENVREKVIVKKVVYDIVKYAHDMFTISSFGVEKNIIVDVLDYKVDFSNCFSFKEDKNNYIVYADMNKVLVGSLVIGPDRGGKQFGSSTIDLKSFSLGRDYYLREAWHSSSDGSGNFIYIRKGDLSIRLYPVCGYERKLINTKFDLKTSNNILKDLVDFTRSKDSFRYHALGHYALLIKSDKLVDVLKGIVS